MWVVSADGGRHLSDAIDPVLERMVDYAQSASFHIGYDPRARVVMFFFATAEDQAVRWAACYGLETQGWWFQWWDVAITASAVAPTDSGAVLFLGDENGYTWAYGAPGAGDGVPGGVPRRVIVGAGATSTVIPVEEDLGAVSLAGVLARHEEGGGYGIVASSTASALTLTAPGLVVPPPAGSTMRIGAILLEYWTAWLGELENKQRPAYLHIKLAPQDTAETFYVTFYADFNGAPLPFSRFTGEVMLDGIEYQDGDLRATVSLTAGSMDGWVVVPVPSSWARAVRARIYSLDATDAFRLVSIAFRPDRSSVQEVVRE
jgi:hypothetical protein